MSIESVAAVDWSGRSRGAEEFIWIAEVRGGELVGLRNGVSRVALPAAVAGADVVGMDFAFSFPSWYCGERSVEQVWQDAADHGDDLLRDEPDPFWGRTKPRGPDPERQLRTTDERHGAKPVFQIGGAGAVGTGSIRGMPVLLALRAAGFAIWPFHAGMPRVIEIYPRVLLRAPVRKRRWRERHAYLLAHHGDQPEPMLERAAGSEDAFDAAISALEMWEHHEELATLKPRDTVEGEIWSPLRPVPGAARPGNP